MPAWVGWLALAAFALRALVPLGFEPGPHGLSIVLCHDGFPSAFFARGTTHQGARGSGSHSTSHCLFCNSATPAPAYRLAGLVRRAPHLIGRVRAQAPSLPNIRFAHIPQARAPPRLV